MKRPLLICLLSTAFALSALPALSAFAADSTLSRASQDLGAASGLVVVGSLSALVGSGTLVVGSAEAVGDGVVVVLRGASNAVDGSATVTVKVSKEVAAQLSAAGAGALSVVAVSTGYALVLAGQVIAYIPNEIGQSLLHHERISGAAA